MKYILQVTGSLNIGGVEKIVVDWYKNMNHNEIQFDFLTYDTGDGYYESSVKELGAEVFKIASPRTNYIKFIKDIKKVLVNKQYDIIHCHTLYNSGFFMKYAAKANIPIRITHSHTTLSRVYIKVYNRIYQKFMLKDILKYSTKYIACSAAAGNYLFTENLFRKFGLIIPNGIDSLKYNYLEENNKTIRRQYSVDSNTILLGMVGRLHKVKNVPIALSILKKLIEKNKNYKLMLVGDGPDKEMIMNIVNKESLEDYVIFVGFQNNTIPFFHSIDILLMPSLFEGFGVTALEGQAAGCICLLSDKIPNFIQCTEKASFLPIDQLDLWIKEILSTNIISRENPIINTQFDLRKVIESIIRLYD